MYLGSKLYLAVFGSQAYRRDRLSGRRRISTTGYRVAGQYSARLVGPYAYRHGACRIRRAVRCSFGRTAVRCQRQGSCSCRHAVGCEPYEVKPEGSNVLIRNRWQYGASAGSRSVCVSARNLVVPVQNPSVLVYPQPAAPVPTLIRRRKAYSATSSPRPARYRKGIQM